MPLFSTAEARAFDKGQLASATDYPDLAVTTKEEEIREWMERVCGVNFVPTSHTDVIDGDGSDFVLLQWPKVTDVTAIRIDGVAVDAAYLNASDYGIGLGIDAEKGIVTSRSFKFTAGWSNVEVTYTAGFAAVPALVKRAALMLAVNEMPAQNAPWTADGFDAGGTSYSFSRGDGYNGNWSPIPDVQKAIRMYMYKPIGVA